MVMSAIRPVPLGVAAAVTLALTAALSACGTPRSSVANTAKQPRATSPAAKSPSTRAAAVTPRVAPSPTRPCTAAELAITPAHRQVANGVQIERFTLATATTAGCILDGTPNLIPKGPLSAQVSGATVDLALSQQDFPDDLDITPPQPTTIPLAPGRSASFYLAWFDASSVVCVQSNGFGLNTPGDKTYTDMRALTYPIGPICDGVFYVSSVF
jgi:hypothetical protein